MLFRSIVNLVAGREAVPELIQDRFTGPGVAAELAKLLDDGEPRSAMLQSLREVISRLSKPATTTGSGQGRSAEIPDPIQRTAAIAESMLLGAGSPV